MNLLRRMGPAVLALAWSAACASAPSPGAPGPGQLAPGRAVTGRLLPSDPQFRDGSHYHRYDFTAQLGEVLTFDLVSDDFDANLIITDRFGNPVARNDDGGERCNARLTYKAPETGPYRLLANSSARGEVGEYRLSVSRGRAAAAADSACRGFGPVQGRIQTGETIEAYLTTEDPTFESDSTHFQRWILGLSAGETVTIDLRSEVFDAYLLLTTSRGDNLAENDDGGGGCHARVVYTATDDRPVRVVVNTSGPGTGRYVLKVTAGAQPLDREGDCDGSAFRG
jgi:hypothetical protein